MAETALAVLNEYPADRFNVLIPVKTLQEISPVHKVIVNEVKINPEPAGKDVYREGESGELALTKKGLAKLMAAANIQVIDSRTISPQKCQRCIEAAGKTRIPPRCGDCPSADDVAYQVTIAVPEPSGTYRIVKGTKELRMEDERVKMKEGQFKRFFPYRTEHCETKALNRALREGLMVNSTYKPEELQKPFAIALVVPNFADPDMKKAMVQRYANGTGELFGGPPKIEIPAGNVQALPDGRTMDTESGEIYETRSENGQAPASGRTIDTTGHVVGEDELPPWLQGEAEDKKETPPNQDIICMQCQRKIETQGKWTPEVIKEYSAKNYKGLILCPDCQKEYKKANR
ncbi:MAG: hypothetical protein ACYDG4_10830 [Desulfuromonadaceae bacterium]